MKLGTPRARLPGQPWTRDSHVVDMTRETKTKVTYPIRCHRHWKTYLLALLFTSLFLFVNHYRYVKFIKVIADHDPVCPRLRREASLSTLTSMLSSSPLNSPPVYDCPQLLHLFNQFFEIEESKVSLLVEDSMKRLYAAWLKSPNLKKETVTDQRVFKVRNKWTEEEAAFNALRGLRPQGDVNSKSSEESKLRLFISNARSKCGFCNVKSDTAGFPFLVNQTRGGRLLTQTGNVFANAFPVTTFHGIVASPKHSLFDLTLEDFLGMTEAARKWFEILGRRLGKRRNVKAGLHRVMTMDTTLPAGASQIHPHLQLFGFTKNWPRDWRRLFEAATRYEVQSGRAYWWDWLKLHRRLGLVMEMEDGVEIVAHFCPIKNEDVFVVSRRGFTSGFVTAIFTLIQRWKDSGVFGVSLGVALPLHDDYENNIYYENNNNINNHNDKNNHKNDDNSGYWAFARLIPRPGLNNKGSDFSSFDLFLESAVSREPFKVIHDLRDSLQRFPQTLQ